MATSKLFNFIMLASFFVVALCSTVVENYDPTAEKWASYIERSTGGDTLNLAPIDSLVSYQRITGATTLTDVPANASIICDVSGSSFTLTLPTASERLLGRTATIVQLNASALLQLTVDSSGGSNDFQTSNTPSNSYVFTAGTYQVHKFTCMDVGSSTLRWVLIY